MEKIQLFITGFLFTVMAVHVEAQEYYSITGDFSDVFQSGEFVIWTPKTKEQRDKDKGKQGGSGSLLDNLNVVARTPLKNGKFQLRGQLDKVQQVSFFIHNAVDKNGRKNFGFPMGQFFILEPGELTLVMDAKRNYSVVGGKYNDAVYNSWKLSDEYKAALAERIRLYRNVKGESEEEKRARLEKAGAVNKRLVELETEGRKKIAMTHPDLLTRKLVIQTGRGDWMLEAAYEIRKAAPQDKWLNDYIARQEADREKRRRFEQVGRVGSGIRDFDAKSLDGKTVSLEQVRSENRYVLLEFWASWCGPCRAEIPHMKKAYAKYRDQGFEILSFTIDDDREAWANASEEEQIPWINTGFGSDSEPKKLYGVPGIPANYLVDGKSGEVIARNLRGQKLEEKLTGLFTGSHQSPSEERRKRYEQFDYSGSHIREFDARSLSGEMVSLKDVRSKNKYVLLELWASWCGPCRAEFPHLKEAYAKYRDRGFEIISYTIDDNKGAWAEASAEEQIPWIDTGFGRLIDPVKIFRVTVPTSFLIDAASGEVISRNLRGDKLGEKLQELFD